MTKMYVIVEIFGEESCLARFVSRDKAAIERRLAALNDIVQIGMPVPGVYTGHSTYYAARHDRLNEYTKLLGELTPPISEDASWELYEVDEI